MPLAIEAHGLGKTYGDVVALKDLHLTVEEGEVFGFLGPNGAGKSTTTKVLTTLIRSTSGEARIHGHDVVDDALAVRRIIGYLPEKVPVYKSMTAREFLHTFASLHAVPPGDRSARVEELLDLVNLQNVDGRTVGGFSKGMTQRLGLARALINRPRVLFLDEPASGLDPTGRKEIRNLMQGLTDEGTTIFLCTHDLAEAQAVCDRIGFIRHGELVRQQAVNEVDAEQELLLAVELDEPVPEAGDAARAVSGVTAVTVHENHLEVRFKDPATRTDIARAIQKAGGLIVNLEEKRPTLEALYEQYVEKPREAGGTGGDP